MSRPLLPDERPMAKRREGGCPGHVLSELQGQGSPALSSGDLLITEGRTRVRIVGGAWKQVAVQETEKPEMLRRILWGTWGMRMEKPAGAGIGQQGDGEQMC